LFLKTFQKPLTSGEEARYIRLLKEGNGEEARQARNILIERNMRLVAHIAKKYQNVEEDMEDLISIGCIGLIKAVNTFDAGKGRLATYACRCIDNELLMLLRSKKKTSREVSLFEPIGQDKEGNEIHLVDVIEQQQIDVVDRMELVGNINKLFLLLEDVLNDREKEIIVLRFGLSGQQEITQSEIGLRLGISRSYVSRIEKKAIRKLKESFEEVST
jgi:RNA polymerase sporulation-specific sigma factor